MNVNPHLHTLPRQCDSVGCCSAFQKFQWPAGTFQLLYTSVWNQGRILKNGLSPGEENKNHYAIYYLFMLLSVYFVSQWGKIENKQKTT